MNLVSQSNLKKETGMMDALRKRKNVGFKNKTRELKTTIEFETHFDNIFPGTDKSCSYILRYFFHTDIHLNKDLNELVSMGGTSFVFDEIDRNSNNVKPAIKLTSDVIKLIGNMYFGYHELDAFLETFPKVRL